MAIRLRMRGAENPDPRPLSPTPIGGLEMSEEFTSCFPISAELLLRNLAAELAEMMAELDEIQAEIESIRAEL
jgi:hypothetical protein